MEINEDSLTGERTGVYLFGVCYDEGTSHHQVMVVPLAETQRQAKKMESLALEEGRLQMCTDWKLLVWRSCGRTPQSRASHMRGWGYIFGFFLLFQRWEQG